MLRRLFEEFDRDGNGTLDKKEIAMLCAKLGVVLKDNEAAEAVRQMEGDSESVDGEVEFDEFVAWWETFQVGGADASSLGGKGAAEGEEESLSSRLNAALKTNQIYYEVEKEVPCDKAVTVEEVVELWSRSKISPETSVWMAGMEDWTPLRECASLWSELKDRPQHADAPVEMPDRAAAKHLVLMYDTGDGPSAEVTIEEVASLVAAGTITDGTDVWTAGMADWTEFGACRPDFGFKATQAAGADSAKYHVLLYDTGNGPSTEITVVEAALLVAEGVISDKTDVWSNGMADWTELGLCKADFGMALAAKHSTLLYDTGDGASGEVSMKEVARLLREGSIKDSTDVWATGMADWTEFGVCKRDFGFL